MKNTFLKRRLTKKQKTQLKRLARLTAISTLIGAVAIGAIVFSRPAHAVDLSGIGAAQTTAAIYASAEEQAKGAIWKTREIVRCPTGFQLSFDSENPDLTTAGCVLIPPQQSVNQQNMGVAQ